MVLLASVLVLSTAQRSLRRPSSHLVADIQGRTEDLGSLGTGPFMPYRDVSLPARASGPFYPTNYDEEEMSNDGGSGVLSAEVLPVKVQHNLLGGNLLVEAERPRGRAVAMKGGRLWGGERSGGSVGSSNVYRLPSNSGSESFGSAIKKILMGIH